MSRVDRLTPAQLFELKSAGIVLEEGSSCFDLMEWIASHEETFLEVCSSHSQVWVVRIYVFKEDHTYVGVEEMGKELSKQLLRVAIYFQAYLKETT